MKGILCKVCEYAAISGSAPEKCPVCGAPKASFVEREDALKIPVDKSNLTELEKKHIPQITLVKKCGLIPEGCVDLHVRLGEIKHPMEEKHYIRYIDFYIDLEFIARIDLTPKYCNPAGALHLKGAGTKITAIANCNLHGKWIAEKPSS